MLENKNDKILIYLNNLSNNNNKEWFHANKKHYQELREFFISQTTELISKISEFDKGVMFEEPKKCIFRINRDIRFSKDKSPYKTNFGAFIVPGGKKSGNAGYYLHIEPSGSFIGGGIHSPESLNLKKIRWYIYENINEFLSIIENSNFKKYFGSIAGNKLKNPPRDFNKEFKHIDLLKFKSYTVIQKISTKFIEKKDFTTKTTDVFKAMFSFVNFLNKALKD